MPRTTGKCKWATIAQLRALKTPLTELCGKPTEEIVTAIKRREHNEKVDGAKRRYCCNA